ncbi:hypothetical protein ACX80Z_10085 [Arthrobacter sp. TMT4-20]
MLKPKGEIRDERELRQVGTATGGNCDGWGLLTGGLVPGQFGELLGLPEWLQAVRPFHHSPAMPVEAFDPVPIVVMGLVAVGGAVLAAYLIRHRDLTG